MIGLEGKLRGANESYADLDRVEEAVMLDADTLWVIEGCWPDGWLAEVWVAPWCRLLVDTDVGGLMYIEVGAASAGARPATAGFWTGSVVTVTGTAVGLAGWAELLVAMLNEAAASEAAVLATGGGAWLTFGGLQCKNREELDEID